ncbi:MAG TPA: ABC transporter ATP-binding protein [Bacillota bacterium]|nr:ABC transporter ATP-binding protein [Bacillota bacterium]
MEPAMKVIHATKSFGKKKAVNDVSFEIYPGEVFGFLGPNGAGKTTMIKMIMSFISMDSGTVIINGFDKKKHYEKAMADIGGIVENPEMYITLSGRLDLEMYARIHDGVTKERIDEVLDLVGMKARANEKVKRYSLGMKQRIGLAQALLHNPKVLILDEPTNGLDPAGIHELRDILKKLAHEEGVAVMVSSHMLTEMQLMCDRVGIITNGTLRDVRLIDELTAGVNGAPIHQIKTSNPAKAKEILSAHYADKIREVGEKSIDIEVSPEEINNCIRELIEGGADILGVQLKESTLEDAFLQITGGGLNIE